jgi:hypothetical protein
MVEKPLLSEPFTSACSMTKVVEQEMTRPSPGSLQFQHYVSLPYLVNYCSTTVRPQDGPDAQDGSCLESLPYYPKAVGGTYNIGRIYLALLRECLAGTGQSARGSPPGPWRRNFNFCPCCSLISRYLYGVRSIQLDDRDCGEVRNVFRSFPTEVRNVEFSTE